MIAQPIEDGIVIRRRNAAKKLATAGYGIVPIPAGQKYPNLPEWQRLTTRDLASIDDMIATTADQYGVYPAKGSGLVVVDEDVTGALDTLGPLPETLIVKTANGRHVYGRLPADVPEDSIPYKWIGGEVRRGGNGQVVGPWSKHPSGADYVPIGGATSITTLPPEWVRALIESRDEQEHHERTATSSADPGWYISVGRHDFLKARARHLRGVGMTGEHLRAEILRLDRERCRPPLQDDRERGTREIDRILDWIDGNIPDDPPEPVALPALTIGTRTAADLSHGAAPPPLVGEFLTQEGATIMYGRGGTGKGMMACYFIPRLVRDGHEVLILDYEGHEREWGSRLRGLGMTADEMAHVHYRAPFAPDWTAKTGPLSEVASLIRADCERLGITYLVVDSYSVATSNGDTMGGEAAAREYFSALSGIGLPSLTIAHVRGDSSRFPERPFGSVFVHNLARETWAVEQRADHEPAPIDDTGYAPAIVALELRNQKANGRPKAPAQFVTFEFYADGSIVAHDDSSGQRKHEDMIAAVLGRDGTLTVKKMREAIIEDFDVDISEKALRVTLGRHPKRFLEGTAGRPHPWSLKPQ